MGDTIRSHEIELVNTPKLGKLIRGVHICVPLTLPTNHTGILTPFWIDAVFYTDK